MPRYSRMQSGGTVTLSSRGTTIVETLVAIALIAVAGFAAIQVLRSGIRENQRSYLRETAASLARQLIEALDGVPYAPAAGTTFVGCVSDTGGSATYVNPCSALTQTNPIDARGQHVSSGGYTRDWSIVDNGVATNGTQNFKTIRVRLRWTDRVAQQLVVTGIKGW